MFNRLTRARAVTDILVAIVYLLVGVDLTLNSDHTNQVLVVLGLAVALGFRRFSPGLALVLSWFVAIFQLYLADIGPIVPDLAILAVLYATAVYGDRAVRWFGFGSVFVGAVLGAIYLVWGSSTPSIGVSFQVQTIAQAALTLVKFGFDLGLLVGLLGLPWTAGNLVRTRRLARASRLAEQTAQLEIEAVEQDVIVEQERNRIARDMHDVVAHSLAVVIAQADGARYARQSDPEAVDGALSAISATAREALADVRLLLGQLRHPQTEGAATRARRPRQAARPVAGLRAHHRVHREGGAAAAGNRPAARGLPDCTGGPHERVAPRGCRQGGVRAVRVGEGGARDHRHECRHGLARDGRAAPRPRPRGHEGARGARGRHAVDQGRRPALRRPGPDPGGAVHEHAGAEHAGAEHVVGRHGSSRQRADQRRVGRYRTGQPCIDRLRGGAIVSGPIRVALVDDQALFRTGIRMLVSSQPDLTFVGEAANGVEGIVMAATSRPDVILMDIRMPVMDGIQATEAILREADSRGATRPRIVVLTTFDLDEAATRAIAGERAGFCSRTPNRNSCSRPSARFTRARPSSRPRRHANSSSTSTRSRARRSRPPSSAP